MRSEHRRGGILALAAGVLAAALFLPAALPARGETATFQKTEQTGTLGDISSSCGILVNADTGEILAAKDETARIVPASMTKVMTVLVAAEALQNKNLSDTVEITEDILETVSADNDAAVGFQAGEVVTVADCLYGAALHSGADAAIALGRYVSGSDDTFVEAMNQKAEELGLSDTHFVNAVGAYDENQYSTVEDIAKILQAALDNDLARKVLSTRQ
ncbi:MAG: serine hydrolase, partial [Lachnospiraceae bacterium]|nr:serine hydrolase [Lachnospiraceae bacterium]